MRQLEGERPTLDQRGSLERTERAPLNVVFVLGARRTGTTLLNQILCNDPGANPHVGECQLLTQLCAASRWAGSNYDRVVQWYFDSRADCDRFFARTIQDFLNTAADHFGEVGKLVLKCPEFSNYKWELDRFVPQGRHVVCVRDPRDQIASELDVGKRQTEQNIDGEAARAYRTRDIGFLAGRLLQYYGTVLRARQDNVLYVRYEDLVLKLVDTLRDIESFTGFDLSAFDPNAAWRRFEHQGEIQKMPAYVEQYGAPLDKSRVGRFRDSLTPAELDLILQLCGEFMDRFYPSTKEGGAPAIPDIA